MISLLDPKVWITAVLIAASSVSIGYWRGTKVGAAGVQTKWDAAVIEWQADKEAQERKYEEAIQQAIAQRDAQLKVVQTDAANARAANVRLRDQLEENRRNLASHPTSTIVNYANTATDVLQECTGRYTEVAEKADGHATDAATLIRAWPSTTFTGQLKSRSMQ